jgi:hypothetical protein
MALPSVTNDFVAASTIQSSKVDQNFTDLINAMTDGTKSFSIAALTLSGTLSGAAGTFTGVVSASQGTTALPGHAFAGALSSGLSYSASGVSCSFAGTEVHVVDADSMLFRLNTITLSTTTAATVNTINVYNLSNTAGAGALVEVIAAGTSATGNPIFRSTTTGSYQWVWGTDNGNSGRFAIAYNNNVGSGDFLTISTLGNVAIGSAALATTATDGFLYIESCAGTPTGVPTAITGRVPIVFDSTNNKLYVYDGGWLATAALT